MLAQADMNFQNVLRTWFYNDDILGWYDDFNAVRTKFFEDHEILENLVPASTGIGAANPFGAALTASLFAMKSHDAETIAHSVASPLQGSAQSYGSSFSRAVLYTSPDHRRLTVSGTASIDMEGKTIFTDDVHAQIEQTFKIVQALLESQQFGWEDTVRGIGYVRNEDDLLTLNEFVASGGAPEFPLLQTINVVCRQDLLFELEVNAVQS
jgi:enamine deaminase RidA (YjgF/YER057c/UK114 family)